MSQYFAYQLLIPRNLPCPDPLTAAPQFNCQSNYLCGHAQSREGAKSPGRERQEKGDGYYCITFPSLQKTITDLPSITYCSPESLQKWPNTLFQLKHILIFTSIAPAWYRLVPEPARICWIVSISSSSPLHQLICSQIHQFLPQDRYLKALHQHIFTYSPCPLFSLSLTHTHSE